MAEPLATGQLLEIPPDWMSESQQRIWSHTVAHAPRGVLKLIDTGVLTAWVIACDQHQTASLHQTRFDADHTYPLLTKDKNGLAVVSPYLGIIHRAAGRMTRLAEQLGFSPSARPRLQITKEDQTASPWSQFRVVNGGRSA